MTNWQDLPLLLTAQQAAEILQVNERTVRRWVDEGRLEGRDLGHGVGYRVSRAELIRIAGVGALTEALDALIDSNEVIDTLFGKYLRDSETGEEPYGMRDFAPWLMKHYPDVAACELEPALRIALLGRSGPRTTTG